MEQPFSRFIPPDPVAALLEGSQMLGIHLSTHVAAQLILYLKELCRWNAKINLSGLETELEIISKHFLDSLSPLKLFSGEPGLKLLDVGTGAGFPGLVLKLQAPALAVTLLEPSQKKAAFLHHIAGVLGVRNLEIVTARLEDFVSLEGFQIITTRAVRAEIILASARRLLVPGGRVLLFRVAPLEESNAEYQLVRECSFTLPFTNAPRTLSLLKVRGDASPSGFTDLLLRP